jgi:ribosomal protein S18 acetylase RimI-like enzyme
VTTTSHRADAGVVQDATVTPAANLRIRRAGAVDWPRIWPLWHEVVAAGDTYSYEPDSTYEQSLESWLGGPRDETWFAENGDGQVLGIYHISPNQPGAGSHIVNGSYMVAASARGLGVGRALVEHSLERAGELGYRGMQFNAVAATNTHAIELYRRLGFTTIGLVPGGFRHPAAGYVDLHIMFRPLAVSR